MSSKNIVVVGSCMMDFVSYAPRLPTSGETIHGKEFVTNFGGKGANQCVAAAKLGGNAVLVARVGDDIWGSKYVENLKKWQVNTDHVRITDNISTGIAQITVSDSGENQIVTVSGANQILSVADVELAQEAITKADVLLLELEPAQDVAIRANQLCRGISILNGAPALTEFDPQLLKLPTIFCVNETEASIFTGGLQVTHICEAATAASALIDMGCNSVIITMGSQGAVYVDNKEKFHVPAPTVESVDSTGAGDAFIGALAFLLANDKNISMRQAVEKACAAASDSVTRPGTQNSFPGPSIFQ